MFLKFCRLSVFQNCRVATISPVALLVDDAEPNVTPTFPGYAIVAEMKSAAIATVGLPGGSIKVGIAALAAGIANGISARLFSARSSKTAMEIKIRAIAIRSGAIRASRVPAGFA
jgi:hypothetical protein